MKILISHLGVLSELVPATSVISSLKSVAVNSKIDWVVKEDRYKKLFKYNKDINNVYCFNEFKNVKYEYDLFINLYPFFPYDECKNIKIFKSLDFNFEDEFKDFKDVLLGEMDYKNTNLFQIYYKLCGLTWGGQGYDISYYPKTKSKKNRIGISVANANLRNYIIDKLKLDDKTLWIMPYKKDIFKKMDEINRCKKIITDDLTTYHLSMSLFKYVYFLETYPLNYKIETFKNGEIIKVPSQVFI